MVAHSLHLIDLPYFDRATVVEVRTVTGVSDSLLVTRGFNHIIAAEDFLRLAVRSISDAHLPVPATHYFPRFIRELVTGVHQASLPKRLAPFHILLDDRLHLFRTDIRKIRAIVVQQQHVFGHPRLSCLIVRTCLGYLTATI